MLDLEALKNPFNITYWWYWLRSKIEFRREHPYYFDADGLTVFVGPQGSGKTLSAVNYVYNLIEKYDKAIIVTNIALTDYPFDNKRVFPFRNADDLSKYNNGEFGVIFLIDEIQLYFNSLESKNINPDVMVQFAQQRKQRKHIVCTSQVFGRMAKPLREQFSSVVVCRNYLGFIQRNQLVNRDSLNDNDNGTSTDLKGEVIKTSLWLHHPKYYQRYDTYYLISRNKFIHNEKKGVDIYGTDTINVRFNN